MPHTRTTSSTRKALTAEAVLVLLNSIPRSERVRFFGLTAEHPDNEVMKRLGNEHADALIWVETLTRGKIRLEEAEKQAEILEEEAELIRSNAAELMRLHQKLENSIPKRGMEPENRRTVELFEELHKKHGKKHGSIIAAIRELVASPQEQDKEYVKEYQKSRRHDPEGVGDLERVRNRVRRLRSTYFKEQEKDHF
jgi:hypothetical protein